MIVKKRCFHVLRFAQARVSFLALCAACLVCLAVSASFAADAKVTFNNKVDRDVFVAICWAKPTSDTEAVMWKKGWYKIEPGKSRTLTVKGIRDLFDMGYYAKSSKDELVWQGSAESYALAGDIHPTKSFETADCSIENGKTVRFRQINLKNSGGAYTATLNLAN